MSSINLAKVINATLKEIEKQGMIFTGIADSPTDTSTVKVKFRAKDADNNHVLSNICRNAISDIRSEMSMFVPVAKKYFGHWVISVDQDAKKKFYYLTVTLVHNHVTSDEKAYLQLPDQEIEEPLIQDKPVEFEPVELKTRPIHSKPKKKPWWKFWA